MTYRSIGWIGWDPKTQQPTRQDRSAGSWRARKEPIKVYTSEGRAISYPD